MNLMQRLMVVVGVVVVLVAGYVLLPGTNEHVTMLLRDKQFGAAHEELMRLYEAGDRRPHMLLQLQQLKELYGDEAGMEEMLKAYLEERPLDVAAHEKLAQFYYFANRYDAYLVELEKLALLDPNAKRLDVLVAQARLHGKVGEELRILDAFRLRTFFSPAHSQRLGLIRLERGQRESALEIFRRMDELSFQENKYWPGRLSFFRELVGEGKLDEAFRRATRWVRQGRNDYHVFVMMKQFERRGRTDLSVALGEEAARFDPKTIFVVVDALVGEKQFERAQGHLEGWRQTVHDPMPLDLVRYVQSCIAAKDLQSAIRLMMSRGLARMPENALLAIGEVLAVEKQHAMLATILPYISQTSLNDRPLFAAKTALMEGREDLARQRLQMIDPARLKAHEAGNWFALSVRILGAGATFEQMSLMMTRKTLPKSLLRQYADLAQALGQVGQADLAWSMLGGRFPLNPTE